VETEVHAGPEEASAEEQVDGLAEQPVAGSATEGGGEDAIAPRGLTAEQLGRLRELLVTANPEAVAELIAGEDFEALLASVEPARAAFARIKEVTAQGLAAGVPRGGGTREIDPAVYGGLSPEGKIAVGLARRG
jgi:hypothetical protein